MRRRFKHASTRVEGCRPPAEPLRTCWESNVLFIPRLTSSKRIFSISNRCRGSNMHGSHTHTHTQHIHNTTSGYESARTNTSNEQTRRTKSSLAHLQGVFDRMDSESISQQPLAAHKKQQSPERPLQKQTGPIRLPSFANNNSN